MSSLAETTIVIANDAQRQVIYRNIWQNWLKPTGVSEEQGVAYCQLGERLETSRDGRITYWALVHRSDPESTDVLSSTRTLRREAKKLNKTDGEVSDVVSYVITSVVTPPHHRKNGYATHMLSLLHYAISMPDTLPPFPTAWGAPLKPEFQPQDATFATLWSDVGRDFYRRIQVGRGEDARDGWIAQFEQEVGWDVTPQAADDKRPTGLPKGWRSFPWVTDIPRDVLEAHTLRTLHTSPTTAKVVAYDPPTSPGILHWIARCRRFFPPALAQEGGVHHVYINDSTTPESAIVVVPDLTPNDTPTLRVSYLALDTSRPDILESAFNLLTTQARAYGCHRVEAMQVGPEIVQAWKALEEKVEVVERDEHLGAMVWYGEEPVEDVQAIGGEYYSWA